MRIKLTILLIFLASFANGQYVLNSIPYFIPSVADRTCGNVLNYSNGLVCTGTCMAFNSTYHRLPTSISLQSICFAPPTGVCNCGGSIRCENQQRKLGADSLVKNKYYRWSVFPLDYLTPVDAQNELSMQVKTSTDPFPVIALWEVNISGVTWWRLVVTVDTVNANGSAPVTYTYNIQPLSTNVWTDWVMEADWQDNHTGYLKFYINGVLVLTRNGANHNKFYNPSAKGYDPIRWGIYKFPYCGSPGTINTTQKLMYFDVLQIGNSNMQLSDFMFSTPPAPTKPVVSAGSNKVITLPTTTTTLQGLSTTANGTITSRQWTQTSGTSATIVSSTSDTTNITGLSTAGVRVFKLKATNSDGLSDSANVTVTVNPAPNVPPVVSAGADQTITLPTSTVNFTGTATDADGSIASVLWTKVSGTGGTITSPTTLSTSVTGLTAGSYVYRLTATDNLGLTASDIVNVLVNPAVPPPNVPPTVSAGANQTITLPTSSVSLTGTATDSDGTIVSVLWAKISGTGGTITNANTNNTTFTGLTAGVYLMSFTATDNNGASATSNMQVTVNAANIPPVVNAGASRSILSPQDTVHLAGTATDSDGTISSYLWEQVEGPAATIVSPTSQNTNITGLAVGTYIFSLSATDNNGATGSATVQITVETQAAGPTPVRVKKF